VLSGETQPLPQKQLPPLNIRPGSGFSGFGGTPPLANLKSTSIGRNNASPTGQKHPALGQDQLPALRSQPSQPEDGVLAYNLLHMIRQFYGGEGVKRSMDWLIKRLIKVGARVSYHARRWSAFPLARHYLACWPGVLKFYRSQLSGF